VIATDLPHIHDNLLFNVRKNNEYLNPIDVSGTLKERHGFVLCEELDWKNPENALADYSSKEFEVLSSFDLASTWLILCLDCHSYRSNL
jgi:hypothetical protein